jgi:Tol biopolymer transport system component
MRIIKLLTFAKEFRSQSVRTQDRASCANAFGLSSVLLLFGLVTGCGGFINQRIAVPSSGTIAFASAAALDGSSGSIAAENIWLGKADGSDATPITKLTNGGASVDNLAWSPDGRKLAFISSRALDGSNAANTNSTFNLWVMNADGSGAAPLTRLTRTNGQGVLDISWSPDGRRIAFESNRALDGSDAVNTNGTDNIWVVSSDGTGAVPLTRFITASAFLPVWSPDGSRIAFTSSGALDGSDVGFAVNIWVMNSDGSGTAPVTRFASAFSQYATFSPDGSKLAFLSNRGLDGSDVFTGAGNMWVANTDGSGAIPLTKYTMLDVGSIFGGVWSPDGKKLAFESTAALDGSDALNTNTTKNVWVANADGSGAIPLTRLAYSTFSAFGAIPKEWSPDGVNLAFISDVALDGSNTPRFLNAWVMKADGSNSKPLTNAGGTSPAWKP